jgi:hypothetical protein
VASVDLVDAVDGVDRVDTVGDGAFARRPVAADAVCSGSRRIIPLLEQVVYLLAGCLERGGRICAIQINGIKGGSHNSVDVASVIGDRE